MSAISIHKRTAALVLAVLLAALATMALISYVRGLETKAFAGVETVTAFIAKENIPADTPADAALSSGLIAKTSIPRKVLADGAISNLEQIRGQVAATTIFKGEQIVAGRFAAAADLAGLLPIPAGRQAVTVQTDLPPAVGGFVQPGDHVSVIAKVEVSGTEAARVNSSLPERSSAVSSSATGVTVVHFLLQDVPVLAVGQDVAGAPAAKDGDAKADASQSQVMLTLAVSPADAERIAYAVMEGQIYFTLLPKGQDAAKTSGRSKANLFR